MTYFSRVSRLFTGNFLVNSPSAEKEKVTIITVAFLLGCIWGVAAPMWNEMVEFGKALSGTLQAYNPSRDIGFTGQITIPALLIKAGFSNTTIALLTSGLACGLAFAAVGAATLVFTDLPVAALVVPVLLCKYPFYNFHGYPVKFPFYFYIFGQVGLYAALLTICLFVLKKHKGAFLMAGLMPIFHIPWAFAVWIFAASYFLTCRRVPSKRLLTLFSFGFSLSLIVFAVHQFVLLPQVTMVNQKRFLSGAGLNEQNISEKLLGKISQIDSIEAEEPASALPVDQVQPPISRGHSPWLRGNPNPLRAFLLYFATDATLLLLLYFLIKKRPLPSLHTDRLAKLFYPLLVLDLLVLVFKIIDELDPTWSSLRAIHPILANSLLRFMPNRFLNLDTIFLPVMFYAIGLQHAIASKNLFCILGLSFILFSPFLPMTDGHSYELDRLLPMLLPNIVLSQLSLAFIGIVIFFERARNCSYYPKSMKLTFTLSYSLLIFVILTVGLKFYLELSANSYLRSKDSAIVNVLSQSHGPLILTLNVQGFENFNVLAQTNRPYYLASGLTVPFPNNPQRKIALDCNTANDKASHAVSVKLEQECFSQRAPELWSYIGKILQSSQILANKDYTLKLPLVVETDDWKLYQISPASDDKTQRND